MPRLLTAGFFVLQASVCLAQTNVPVVLTWEAPKDCPQSPEVQQQLRALLPSSRAEQTNSPFLARGTIEPAEGRYRLTLSIERAATHGSRVIESDDCRSLAKAATIVLALLVQKERSLGRELLESEISGQSEQSPKPAQPNPEEEPESPPAIDPVPPVAPPAVPESIRPWRLLLRAPEGRIDFVTLPRAGYGVGLGVGLAYHEWRAFITGTLYGTERMTLSGTHPYDVSYRRKTLEGKLCRRWISGSFEAAPCAVIAADHVSAHASGEYLDSSDETAVGISMGGAIAGYLHLQRHLALVATATGRLTVNRARFVVHNLMGKEQVHQLPWASLDVALACEWIF